MDDTIPQDTEPAAQASSVPTEVEEEPECILTTRFPNELLLDIMRLIPEPGFRTLLSLRSSCKKLKGPATDILVERLCRIDLAQGMEGPLARWFVSQKMYDLLNFFINKEPFRTALNRDSHRNPNELLRLKLKGSPVPRDKWSPVQTAVDLNDIVAMEILLAAGASVNEIGYECQCTCDDDMARDAVEPPASDLAEPSASDVKKPSTRVRHSVLHVAVCRGHADMAKFLLLRGAVTRRKHIGWGSCDYFEESALDTAFRRKNTDLGAWIILKGYQYTGHMDKVCGNHPSYRVVRYDQPRSPTVECPGPDCKVDEKKAWIDEVRRVMRAMRATEKLRKEQEALAAATKSLTLTEQEAAVDETVDGSES